MKIYIASDHGGFELKKEIVEELSLNYSLQDLGPKEFDPNDDYPDFAAKVSKKVQQEEDSIGILICKSGNGMCITANKFKGIYAALAFSSNHAIKAREHNNANVLCIDSDYDGESPIQIIRAFLTANFAGTETRHGRRFEKIKRIEESK